MAQRFAIDGNFTQSFVGTVSLNTQACPSNNSEDFASLFYDLDTGTVCYITSSTDFCYEFIFDNENTIPLSKNAEGVQSQPPAQSFQFVGDPNTPPIGATNLSAPKNSLTNTKFLMFDSSSANAGSLLNYLIQNTESGSIKLSTTTQAVEINYTTQAQTGSLGNNKIIIGNFNNLPAFASSSFSVLTTTSDTPFTHGERVCVEVNSAGSGGSSTGLQETLESGNSSSLGISSSFTYVGEVSFTGSSSTPVKLTKDISQDYIVASGSGLVIQPIIGTSPTAVEGSLIYSASNFYVGIEI